MDMDFEFERFVVAIDLLIELHKQRAKVFSEDRSAYRHEVFAALFSTVSIDIGRQTGKSEYIRNRATSDDLVIVDNQRLARLFSKDLTVRTALQVLKAGDRSLARFNRVFIDEASLVFKTIDKNTLYKKCASDVLEQTFILLG